MRVTLPGHRACALLVFTALMGCGGDDRPGPDFDAGCAEPGVVAGTPVIRCPSSVLIECVPSAGSPLEVAVDVVVCGGGTAEITCSPERGSLVMPGTVTEGRCTARSPSGAEAACTFGIQATPAGSASLVCTPSLDVSCGGPLTSIPVPPPMAVESCGRLAGPVVDDAPSGGFPVGETVVSFTAPTELGTTVGCDTRVRVLDGSPPSIECSPAVTIARTSPDEPALPPPALAMDNCDDALAVEASPPSLDRGMTTVTYVATDDAGLTGTCTTDVEVLDVFAPTGFRIISAALELDGTTDVTVAWEASTGADVTGYAVERAAAPEGPWTRLRTTARAARTFTDAALDTERALYRVVAVSGSVDGGATPPLTAHSIGAAGYDLRDRTVPTVPFTTTLYGVVRHPVDLAAGPFPFVLFIHGNHGICRRTFTSDTDVCGTSTDHECPFGTYVTTPNAEGYVYLQETLAAQGYVTASISANALNCRDDYILERAQLIIAHLRRWLTWTGVGGVPFGTTFAGAVDMRRVALVGHSRGGEAVGHVPAILAASPVPGVRVESVFAIAPTDYHDPQLVQAAYAVLLPTCDGDVSTLEGMNAYDRSLAPEPGRRQSQVVFAGANHNFFNTEWRQDDNGDGRMCSVSLEVGGAAQRGMLEGVLGTWINGTMGTDPLEGFARAEGGVPQAIDIWAGTALDLRWSYADGTRLPIDAFEGMGTPDQNLLGQPNVFTGFSSSRRCVENACDSQFDHAKGAMLLSWDGAPGTARVGLGALDASGYDFLSFRVASRSSTLNTGRTQQDFFVRVSDAGGTSARVRLGAIQRIPHLYPARSPLELLQTVRVPFEALRSAAPALDTASLASVEILVPAPDSTRGSVLLTDVELAR